MNYGRAHSVDYAAGSWTREAGHYVERNFGVAMGEGGNVG